MNGPCCFPSIGIGTVTSKSLYLYMRAKLNFMTFDLHYSFFSTVIVLARRELNLVTRLAW